MLERYLLIWLGLLSGMAYFWGDLHTGLVNPFIASKPAIPYLISITMFAVGCLMRHDELVQVVRDWRSVLAGTVIQYTATPFLAWAFARSFGLQDGALLGVILVGCVPGAMASNILTLVARGNVSYSVSLTTVSTILSPLAVPAGMYVCLGQQLETSLLDTAMELLVMVVGPVVAGRVVTKIWPAMEKLMQVVSPVLAPITILWIIASVVGSNRDKLSEGMASVVAALAGINLAGYVVGYYGGALLRFDEGVRRALTIEIGMQNAGLGVALAMRLFPDHPDAQVPPALFTVGSMFTATILVQYWAARGRRSQVGDP
jgi:bile acid:Na+ symporter, BASS family